MEANDLNKTGNEEKDLSKTNPNSEVKKEETSSNTETPEESVVEPESTEKDSEQVTINKTDTEEPVVEESDKIDTAEAEKVEKVFSEEKQTVPESAAESVAERNEGLEDESQDKVAPETVNTDEVEKTQPEKESSTIVPAEEVTAETPIKGKDIDLTPKSQEAEEIKAEATSGEEGKTVETKVEPEKVEPEKESSTIVPAGEVTAETPIKGKDTDLTPKSQEAVEVNAEATSGEEGEAVETKAESEKVEPEKSEEEEAKPVLEKVDLSTLNREQLVNRLRHINKIFDVPTIREEVEDIKSVFYKLFNEEVEELKARFLESGEVEENFAPPVDAFEVEMKELLKDFRYKKAAYMHKLDTQKEKNLEAKMEVIEAIKNLINRQESLNETFNEFKMLQQKFHDIGSIPQNKVRDVWDTYNLHIENFYNYVKINKELRDLDLKKNLVLKTELCEKAEALLEETAVVNSFKTLQKYHDRWREIGPVPKEKKDELWERFKAATTKINQKHQEYFEGLKDQLKENLKQKTALCEKAEEIVKEEAHSPKEWEGKSKKLIELQQTWKTIGFAPKKDNNAIYERFRSACDKFFENKRAFFKSYKNEQQQHLIQKTELCEKAEAMKDSTDWRKTTEEYIRIQKEWKQIGPVPRRQSDAIWHRFRTACDAFFDNKSKFFNKIDESQEENLKKKMALIEEIKGFKNLEDNEDTFNMLQDYQRKFSEIGHVPFKLKDNVNQEFRNEINKHFDALNMDEYHRNVQKFRNRLENIKHSDHQDDKVSQERHKLMTKLKQLENDIIVWENNIGFFAKSKNSDSLIKDFQHKIENGKRNAKLLQEKIRMLNKLED
ncbi:MULTISPECIES: DUF349 domain-containing protein [unclassified Saccharicrinis]|uniref:DUF349 domain-containing protein n=1 Tax=unclassified Saccharicrinis TaxID=2646859 RepID=UPI003D355581